MSAVRDIAPDRLMVQRVVNLCSQFRLSREEKAELLRAAAEEISPSARFAQLKEVTDKVRPASNEKRTPKSDAERSRLRRMRKREGVSVLQIYLTYEKTAIFVQRKFISMHATESRAELEAEIQRLVDELAEAAR